MEKVVVVVGGGRSSRMGVDKLALRLEGRTLLERCTSAGLTWASRAIVAGDEPDAWVSDARVTFRREDPPFGGPVAGLAAALAAAPTADEVMILAGDLAHPDAAVALLSPTRLRSDGVALLDAEGWPQYLAGRYFAASVRRAIAALDTVRDSSVRRLMRPLDVTLLPAPAFATLDLDTPEVAKISGAIDPQMRI